MYNHHGYSNHSSVQQQQMEEAADEVNCGNVVIQLNVKQCLNVFGFFQCKDKAFWNWRQSPDGGYSAHVECSCLPVPSSFSPFWRPPISITADAHCSVRSYCIIYDYESDKSTLTTVACLVNWSLMRVVIHPGSEVAVIWIFFNRPYSQNMNLKLNLYFFCC